MWTALTSCSVDVYCWRKAGEKSSDDMSRQSEKTTNPSEPDDRDVNFASGRHHSRCKPNQVLVVGLVVALISGGDQGKCHRLHIIKGDVVRLASQHDLTRRTMVSRNGLRRPKMRKNKSCRGLSWKTERQTTLSYLYGGKEVLDVHSPTGVIVEEISIKNEGATRAETHSPG